MVSIYRITGSIYVEEDQIHNEFNTIMVGNDIRKVISSYLDMFSKAEILEVNRLNYTGELVFNVI